MPCVKVGDRKDPKYFPIEVEKLILIVSIIFLK